jgi:hypothetical protein
LAWRPLRAALGLRAPAGTLVSVPDPEVHRHGVAIEPGTQVLALGGDPLFRPAGHEWICRVRPLLAGRLDRARALADEGLAELPDSPGLMYVQALVAAAEQAREWLAKAVAREPLLLEEARAEPQLAALAGDLDP